MCKSSNKQSMIHLNLRNEFQQVRLHTSSISISFAVFSCITLILIMGALLYCYTRRRRTPSAQPDTPSFQPLVDLSTHQPTVQGHQPTVQLPSPAPPCQYSALYWILAATAVAPAVSILDMWPYLQPLIAVKHGEATFYYFTNDLK